MKIQGWMAPDAAPVDRDETALTSRHPKQNLATVEDPELRLGMRAMLHILSQRNRGCTSIISATDKT